ncbi:MAG: peptidase T [Candidatus Onthomonas sp.]
MSGVTERFYRYIAVDTTSVDDAACYPSSENQLVLARQLEQEMRELGLSDVRTDEYGYVTGTIPANREDVPVIGLIAHMDTSNAVSGADIQARTVLYEGGDILLNQAGNIHISAQDAPELSRYVGQHLIVTDGTTLLGADDKAGIAEILTAAERLLRDSSIPHGEIRLCFTPDEEVGEGTKYFDVAAFGADYAYTVDGEALGELEYENFNAATAKVIIHGKSMHPGASKGRMVNALMLAWELQGMLPWQEQPAYTEGYEGFYHLESMEGTVTEVSMRYLIRDHDRELFQKRKERMEKIAAYLNDKYGSGTVELSVEDSYYNMKEKIAEHMDLVERAKDAFAACGVAPKISPIRGGTDGARLSYLGLPCPNLSTGGHNCHSVVEFIPCESMETMVDVLIHLASSFAGQTGNSNC